MAKNYGSFSQEAKHLAYERYKQIRQEQIKEGHIFYLLK